MCVREQSVTWHDKMSLSQFVKKEKMEKKKKNIEFLNQKYSIDLQELLLLE